MKKHNCGSCEFLDRTQSREFNYTNRDADKDFSGTSYFCKKNNCYVSSYATCDNKYLSLSKYIFSRSKRLKKTYKTIQNIIMRDEESLKAKGFIAQSASSRYCYVTNIEQMDKWLKAKW